MPESLVVAEVDPASHDAAALIAELDRDLISRYPGLQVQGIHAANFRQAGGVFFIGRIGDVPAACGALRPIDSRAVEVKRMFVSEGYRRRGFARAILRVLEEKAAQRGYSIIRLETGGSQPEAIALYESAGYHTIPCYGDHASDPLSRCFEKRLP
jgi:GNAT superfamily N-acetyltransferase